MNPRPFSDHLDFPGAITAKRLMEFAPLLQRDIAHELASALAGAMLACAITTPARVRAFMTHVAFQTFGLKSVWSGYAWRFEETLDLPADRLARIYPQHFASIDAARACAHDPTALAAKLYAGRCGNQDGEDAYKFRRRGLLGLVGRANYLRASDWLGDDFILSPVYVSHPQEAAWLAGHFWRAAGLNEEVDAGRERAVAQIIASQLALGVSADASAISHTDAAAYPFSLASWSERARRFWPDFPAAAAEGE